MRNEITAAEAYLIACNEYENLMNGKIEGNLCSIYSRIHSALKKGAMGVNVVIDIYEEKHKQKLSSLLEEKGFKTRFAYDEFSGDHYINVSWSHIGNEK